MSSREEDTGEKTVLPPTQPHSQPPPQMVEDHSQDIISTDDNDDDHTGQDIGTDDPGQDIGTDDNNDDACCPLCKEEVTTIQKGVQCNMCSKWSHKTCLNLSDEEYMVLTEDHDNPWFCARCMNIKANKIRWGEYEGETEIKSLIKSIYDQILNWKNNIFSLPRGKCGVDFVKELTRLINLSVRKSGWERLALSLVHIYHISAMCLLFIKERGRKRMS